MNTFIGCWSSLQQWAHTAGSPGSHCCMMIYKAGAPKHARAWAKRQADGLLKSASLQRCIGDKTSGNVLCCAPHVDLTHCVNMTTTIPTWHGFAVATMPSHLSGVNRSVCSKLGDHSNRVMQTFGCLHSSRSASALHAQRSCLSSSVRTPLLRPVRESSRSVNWTGMPFVHLHSAVRQKMSLANQISLASNIYHSRTKASAML